MFYRRISWLAFCLAALSLPSFATVIMDTETPGVAPVIGVGTPYDFTFTFPGLTGVDITQLVIQFTFEDDEEGNCPTECEQFALLYTDGGGNTLLSGGVSNWPLGGANPFTITGVDLVPIDNIEDGTSAATMFAFMTDGSDDLDISIRSTSGDFRFITATATVTFDEPVDPGDVPEPATALLLGAGLVGLGLVQRKRVRLH